MRRIFTLLILILPISGLAQTNYHSGFIVKNSGDTLKGYIDYREWANNPKTIDFKVNKNDQRAESFSPVKIKAFQINGMESYVSYIGVVSMDKNSFPDIPRGMDTTKKQDTAFLRKLSGGKYIVLYSYIDRIKTRFFVAGLNSRPVELKYYEYYNDYNQVTNSATYKGQLMLYADRFAAADDKLPGKISLCKFKAEDLEAIADEINNGKTVKRKSQTRAFIGAAVNYTTTSTDNIGGFAYSKTSTTIAPKVSVGINFFENPNVQRFVFRTELSLSYINPQFLYPVTVDGTGTNEVYKYTQYTTGITPQLLYNFYNSDDFKVFIGLGISLNLSFYSNNKFTIQSNDPSVVNAYTIKDPFDLALLWATVPLQAGVTINKKMDIFATYDVASFSSTSRSICLGVRFSVGGR